MEKNSLFSLNSTRFIQTPIDKDNGSKNNLRTTKTFFPVNRFIHDYSYRVNLANMVSFLSTCCDKTYNTVYMYFFQL